MASALSTVGKNVALTQIGATYGFAARCSSTRPSGRSA